MRILFWSAAFWPYIGGVEVLGGHLVRALHERGHEVLVVAPRDSLELSVEDDFHGVPIVRYAFRQPLEQRDVEGFAAGREWCADLQNRFEPDLVHLYHPGIDVVYHRSSAARAAPTVVSLHLFYPASVLRRGVIARAVNDATSITACSQSVLADLLSKVPELATKASALPNRLPPPERAPTPLPFDPPVVLLLGRAVPQKGFDLGLQAFRSVVDQIPAARLVIAGHGLSRDELSQQVAALGLNGAVEFRGWVAPERVPALINEATVVAMPSRVEPFGLVALQAAHMARPLVGFGVGGLVEAVVNGETGVLVPPGNVEALADALVNTLADADRARTLGAAGRARFGDRSSWECYVDAHEELYEQAVASRSAA